MGPLHPGVYRVEQFGLSYEPGAFCIVASEDNSHIPCASLAQLAEEIQKYDAKDKNCKQLQWFRVQLMHYGLPNRVGKEDVVRHLRENLAAGTLKVPEYLKTREKELMRMYHRREKQRDENLAINAAKHPLSSTARPSTTSLGINKYKNASEKDKGPTLSPPNRTNPRVTTPEGSFSIPGNATATGGQTQKALDQPKDTFTKGNTQGKRDRQSPSPDRPKKRPGDGPERRNLTPSASIPAGYQGMTMGYYRVETNSNFELGKSYFHLVLRKAGYMGMFNTGHITGILATETRPGTTDQPNHMLTWSGRVTKGSEDKGVVYHNLTGILRFPAPRQIEGYLHHPKKDITFVGNLDDNTAEERGMKLPTFVEWKDFRDELIRDHTKQSQTTHGEQDATAKSSTS